MVIAGIVAGGTGTRMGQNTIPKQFLEIADKPIIIHTIEKFITCFAVDYIIVGVHCDWEDTMKKLISKYFNNDERIIVIIGGATRTDTLKNIVDAAKVQLNADKDTIMVTHDAVRPFVSQEIIEENVNSAREYGACGTVISAVDTIIQSDNGKYVTDIPIRSEMYQAQTPQSFKVGIFDEVYESLSKEELDTVTDACKLFYLRGYDVQLVMGDVSNFKITYPFELRRARVMMDDNKLNG